MEVPLDIPEEEGGKLTLKQKINEILAHLRSQSPVVDDIVTVSPPASISALPFSFEGFTSSTASGFLNAPSGGYTDETGNHLVGIIKMDRVPLSVREAYRAWQEGQVQG